MTGLTAQQHEARLTGIGGSDAAAVLGVSPWKTPVDVYLEKTGNSEPFESTERMLWGNLIEPAIADEVARRMDTKLRRRNTTLRHKHHEFIIAHLDREFVGGLDGKKTILEIKTVGYASDEWGDENTDQIPQHYLAQVAHYMAVTGALQSIVAALFMPACTLKLYRVLRNVELEGLIITAEFKFWHDHVLKQVPPPATTITDARKLWKQDDGGLIVADGGMLDCHQALLEAKADIKDAEDRKKEMEQMIMTYMGENAELVDDAGKTLATWKSQTSRRLDTKAFSAAHPELAEEYKKATLSRVLRVKE